MIDTGFQAAIGNREIDARIVEHPFRIIFLDDRRLLTEHTRIKADVGSEIIDGDMDMKAFHVLAPFRWDLRLDFFAGAASAAKAAGGPQVMPSRGPQLAVR